MAGLAEIRTGRIASARRRRSPFGDCVSDLQLHGALPRGASVYLLFLVYAFQSCFVVTAAFGVNTGVLAQFGNVFIV